MSHIYNYLECLDQEETALLSAIVVAIAAAIRYFEKRNQEQKKNDR